MLKMMKPNLYLGDCEDAKRAPSFIDTVVSLAETCRTKGDLLFPIVDGPDPKNKELMENAINTVDAELRKGRTVLIHCQAGISRTPAVEMQKNY